MRFTLIYLWKGRAVRFTHNWSKDLGKTSSSTLFWHLEWGSGRFTVLTQWRLQNSDPKPPRTGTQSRTSLFKDRNLGGRIRNVTFFNSGPSKTAWHVIAAFACRGFVWSVKVGDIYLPPLTPFFFIIVYFVCIYVFVHDHLFLTCHYKPFIIHAGWLYGPFVFNNQFISP